MPSNAAYHRAYRARETPEKRERRLAYQRAYQAARIAKQTPAQREARLAYLRAYSRLERSYRRAA